ncbi:Zn(2)-Cys(6) binuclear cluster domain-containing protein [Mycena metata]|uniref:Zn(2)-Cys(6) binuclear cluster domain-containing protein n=1 Tax=Mycena metata TaxID=1033252 RepID=A0AAD7IXK1_9AGAR|nr:Zn(2)-Cys(6) binuclear cluster domain-containing protein [Mycena metata]
MSQPHSPSPISPLHKGKACQNCRRRKVKCDGARPMCGPCSRYSVAFGDCEYTEGGPSNGQMLEEQISILQARINELEKPENRLSSGSVSRASGSRGHPVSSTSQLSPSNAMALGPLLSYFHQQQTSGASVNVLAANAMPTELPFIVLQALVHNFLHNATCFGFFLDTQAFHDAVTSANGRNLPPVLLNVMYLWGVHLSQDGRIKAYESAFLAHALRSTAGSLAGTHPRTILHSAQASVLLAHYFLRNSRALEGRYHISAAVATVLSAGLHLIRGRTRPPTAEMLPPPGDAAEEGERIAAFWRVLTLNNCWAGVEGAPSNVTYGSDGLAIDTPWPLESRDYVERPNMLPRQSSGTVARFLTNGSNDASSGPALHAKVGILFENATRLGMRYRAGGISRNDTELGPLDRRTDAFIAALPPVQSKDMLMIHTLAHGATIRLHEPLLKDHAFARTKALTAARGIVEILMKTDVPKVGVIDPVLAPLWTSACRILITEVVLRRAQGGAHHTQGIIDSLNIVITAMQFFASDCRLVATQLETIRRACKSAQIGA